MPDMKEQGGKPRKEAMEHSGTSGYSGNSGPSYLPFPQVVWLVFKAKVMPLGYLDEPVVQVRKSKETAEALALSIIGESRKLIRDSPLLKEWKTPLENVWITPYVVGD